MVLRPEAPRHPGGGTACYERILTAAKCPGNADGNLPGRVCNGCRRGLPAVARGFEHHAALASAVDADVQRVVQPYAANEAGFLGRFHPG